MMNGINWFFGIVFVLLGILNWIFVSGVPGFFYLILSLAYLPPFAQRLDSKFDVATAALLKVSAGVVILWATLAVGDLVELVGL